MRSEVDGLNGKLDSSDVANHRSTRFVDDGRVRQGGIRFANLVSISECAIFVDSVSRLFSKSVTNYRSELFGAFSSESRGLMGIFLRFYRKLWKKGTDQETHLCELKRRLPKLVPGQFLG